MKVGFICLASLASFCAEAKFVDAKIEARGPVQTTNETVSGKAASLLPAGKKWRLVWHDEFDQKTIDKTKWMCRESFWGHDFPAFAHDYEGVEMTGETVKLNLVRKGDDFTSPHLQTGSLTYDIPRDSNGFWPFGKYRKPLFMKKYGYFEIRCRQPKYPGWHSAFWFQAPGVGSHPDAGVCGVETDIMENYQQHTKGMIVGGNGWGGYGKNSCWYDHFEWKHEETADGWHWYGCDWTPEGYTFYCDGKKVGEQNYPVSHVPQFLLVSTEPGGIPQSRERWRSHRRTQDEGVGQARSASFRGEAARLLRGRLCARVRRDPRTGAEAVASERGRAPLVGGRRVGTRDEDVLFAEDGKHLRHDTRQGEPGQRFPWRIAQTRTWLWNGSRRLRDQRWCGAERARRQVAGHA